MAAEKNKDTARVSISFNRADPAQKMACNLLRSAGYGKRAAITAKAICLLVGSAAGDTGEKKQAPNPEPEDRMETIDYQRVEEIVNRAVLESLGQTQEPEIRRKETVPCRGIEPGASAQTGTEKPAGQGCSKPAGHFSAEDAVEILEGYAIPDSVLDSALDFADMFG